MKVAYQYFMTEELRRLRQIAKAAMELCDNDGVQGCIGNESPDDAPAETYEVPAKVWEKFEKAMGHEP